MVHKMKLLEEPFNSIKDGSKTIEFRLNDEKRKNVNVGDRIEFYKLPDLEERIVVTVLDLYHDYTFFDLFSKLYDDKEEIERKSNAMYDIYTKKQEEKYGVLGIKIKLEEDNCEDDFDEYN